jgi:CubicO group peptidase (beta-lactamase class C family)
MRQKGTRIFVLLVVFGAFVTTGCSVLTDLFSIGAGSKAQLLCSNVFTSGRSVESVLEQEACLECRMGDIGALEQLIECQVDFGEKSVACSMLWVKRKSIFREHLGCTLLCGTKDRAIALSEGEVRSQEAGDLTPLPPGQEQLPWPTGDLLTGEVPPEVNAARLEAALDEAFSEPDPEHLRRTRGVVVVYDGQLVAERYAEAEGYSMPTPHYGWSMTKSVTNAQIGILVGQGELDIYEPAPVPQWADPSDPRHAITTDQLLRMSSGLYFDEGYDSPFVDNLVMLYGNIRDMAAYAANKNLVAEPDTVWHYSSGTSMILAGIVRSAFDSPADSFAFPRRALFDRVGMRSALIEADQAGTFVGESLMWATPRDWARFGLLCLQDGVWEGERILPEGWMAYSTSPTPTEPSGWYGAQFWLNVGGNYYPSLPEDLFACEGHDGQFVTMIPSRNLVVVRVGYTLDAEAWDHEAFMLSILDAIGEPSDRTER